MIVELQMMEKLGLFEPIDHDHKRFEILVTYCDSPIEKIFWSSAYFTLSRIGKITPQLPVGKYRIDFALTDIPEAPLIKVAIELDGHEFHKSKEQRQSDYQRERYLQRQGWKIIRFTGSEIYGDVQGRVKETVNLINEYIYWLGFNGGNDEYL
jgi:very-short-patch-repair endonuclease